MDAPKRLEDALPADVHDSVRRVLEALSKHGISFLAGGMTTLNAYYGNLRQSQDLDVFITSDRSVGGIRYALNQDGIKTGRKRSALFLAVFIPERADPVIDVITPDTFSLPLTQDSLAHAVPLTFKGLQIKGMSTEEILLTKAARGSPRDKADILKVAKELERQGAALDWRFLEERAAQWHRKSALKEVKELFRPQAL
jgi:predicted nucleotidyltransferase